jgi:hypothetical protein
VKVKLSLHVVRGYWVTPVNNFKRGDAYLTDEDSVAVAGGMLQHGRIVQGD